MKSNLTKAKLQAGESAFGCFVRHSDPGFMEMLGYLGWDFIVFDGEHAPNDPRDVENLARALSAFDVTPIARVPTNQQPIILRYLDTGVGGVVVPWVNTPDEAEAVVQAVKYYPRGKRGLAGVRAADFGLREPLGQYIARANAESLVIVQCESLTAVDHAATIAGIDGVDVVFVGPNDLSQSMGLPGQTTHPDVIAAIQRVIDAVTPTGKAVGILARDLEMAKFWHERGVRLVATNIDSIIAGGVRGYLGAARSWQPR
jgi:4-hydroxy-2-oxoheptanedioate aldolase